MASSRAADIPEEDRPSGRTDDRPPNVEDELIGLDPHDPETRAFAEHLDRMQRQTPGFTVEGYLAGVENFADSVNRTGGLRRLTAVAVVLLILLGVAISVWFGLGEILSTFFD
ncbi:hypothetical protein ABZ816_38520 [Actinosynnema sp. NPDC047251]|uniref:Putative membrane protein n=1 Tax=Saccharothrix espanaensis (strain ATCC 51144 / DSM 44229 / JCM 9112 / NBRC 15066 / NRRL 15764) TaxID=1179773 RepID=K0JPV3_SACES|nr:hypothetical protein [Saccharothrix espanaensis]CCH29195.1 putative membrane protein [Saccharothrix espanaensis DSM 44229]